MKQDTSEDRWRQNSKNRKRKDWCRWEKKNCQIRGSWKSSCLVVSNTSSRWHCILFYWSTRVAKELRGHSCQRILKTYLRLEKWIFKGCNPKIWLSSAMFSSHVMGNKSSFRTDPSFSFVGQVWLIEEKGVWKKTVMDKREKEILEREWCQRTVDKIRGIPVLKKG